MLYVSYCWCLACVFWSQACWPELCKRVSPSHEPPADWSCWPAVCCSALTSPHWPGLCHRSGWGRISGPTWLDSWYTGWTASHSRPPSPLCKARQWELSRSQHSLVGPTSTSPSPAQRTHYVSNSETIMSDTVIVSCHIDSKVLYLS